MMIMTTMTSGKSNLTTGRIAIAHGRFNHTRQVASLSVYCYATHASLGPSVSKFPMQSRSTQPFLHSSRQRVVILCMGPPLSPLKLTLPVGDLNPIPSNIMVSWVHSSPEPKRHLERFSRLCRAHDFNRQRDRPTDHAIRSVTAGRSTAMRPINNNN